ncbi:uncharacterized protein LOC141718989 [Apium graveolens]|uniref:uncharacterized protein LOC141718989 n=1 Tax=Apium graveolens TaxID=4045 RepID=UPI003D792ABF
MVISWLHNNVCDSIKKSILFINSASEIWKQLAKLFQLSNGSRKYKMNKELLGMKQGSLKVNDYYTGLTSMWEELDSMNLLPVITTVSPEVTALLQLKLRGLNLGCFVFLNGLNKVYGPMRSQLLMNHPLPNVETACAVIQQEESQRDVLAPTDVEFSAMYSKGFGDNKAVGDNKPLICSACGGRGHYEDRCWTVVGYPKWHLKHKKPMSKPANTSSAQRWSNTNKNNPRFANNVSLTPE